MKKIFFNFFKFAYINNFAIISSLVFILLYGLNINFFDCLKKSELFKFNEILMYVFLGLSIIFIVSNIYFIKLIIQNPMIIKNTARPSRFGEFKDFYILTPLISMAIIGFLKSLSILFIKCSINQNVTFVTYFIYFTELILVILVSLNLRKILLYLKRKIHKKISYVVFNSIFLLILLFILNFALNKSVLFLKNLEIIMFFLLFYVGCTGFIYIKTKLDKKYKNNKYKFFNSINLKETIFYILIFVILMSVSCFPDYFKILIKKVSIFINCVISNTKLK